MSRSIAASFIVLVNVLGANGQQPQPVVVQNSSPRVVTVVHTVDLQKMLVRMREQKNVRVGVAPSAPAFVYNIATGLIVDNAGHIVTRLANLDLQDKDPKVSITTSAGASMTAKLIGVDCATGFAVLEVPSLVGGIQLIASPITVSNGMIVSIVSSDVVKRMAPSGGGNLYLSPILKLSQGNVLTKSPFANARGALTLLSNSLMARNDSSVAQTLDGQVIGITQWAGFGRAYLFPVEFIRDTVAKRVIERKDNVPAGWLGAIGTSLDQLLATETEPLGLDRKTGVIVREVLPDSPAAASGIAQNDVIVGVDGWEVVGVPDLKAMLSWYPAGQKITLNTIRDRKPMAVSVVLGARPDSNSSVSAWLDQSADPILSQREELEKRLAELQGEYRTRLKNAHSRERDEALKELEMEIRQLMDMYRTVLASTAAASNNQLGQPYLPDNVGRETISPKPATQDVTFKAGFKARELTSQLAAQFKALGGILISSVVKDSAAHRAGIRAGDVIISSKERLMLSIAQLQVLLSDQEGDISLKLIRDGQPTIVTLHSQ